MIITDNQEKLLLLKPLLADIRRTQCFGSPRRLIPVTVAEIHQHQNRYDIRNHFQEIRRNCAAQQLDAEAE
ncbi:hypothetical protein D3C76_1465990 [compost metagenome]